MTMNPLFFLMSNPNRRIYDVPTLSVDDIVSMLNEVHIPVKQRHILNPQANQTRLLFRMILEVFCSWRIKEIDIDKEVAKTTFSDYRSHEHFVEYTLVHLQLQGFLRDLHYENVELTDLTQPTSPRLIQILSVVLNYYLFIKSSRTQVDTYRQQLDEISLEITRSETKKDELVAKIEQESQERDALAKAADDDLAQLHQMCVDLKERYARYDEEKEEVAVRRREKDERRSELENMKSELNGLMIREKEVRKIMTVNVDDLKEKVELARLEIQKKTQLLNEKLAEQNRVDCTEEYREKSDTLDEAISLFNTLKGIQSATKEYGKVTDTRHSEMLKVIDIIHGLDTSIENCNTELALLDDQMKSVIEQQEKKRESVRLININSEKEDDKVNEQIVQLVKEEEEFIRQAEEVREKIQQKKNEHNHFKRSFDYKMDQFMKSLDHFISNFQEIEPRIK
ncbi:Nuf2 family-domain-containing protein [Pilobolus umbonatus]|nr:Nuf2 family-domain-containing protein [Pilobolus umbonatus]